MNFYLKSLVEVRQLTSTPLAYIKRDLSTIPLEPKGKRPLIKWEPFQHRRPTPEQVMRWAQEHPGCNWAIVTGAVSGVVVLDLDSPEAAQEIKQRGVEDVGPVVKTGKGWHLYFRHPGHPVQNAVKLLPGVDVRGDGGYVAAPPSVHPSGAVYRWAKGRSILEIEPPPLPEWVEELLNQPQEPAGGVSIQLEGIGDDIERIALGVGQGERNQATARLAGYLFSFRRMNPKVAVALLEAWNLTNRPPLPLQELHRAINSIAKRQARKEMGE
ncbi:Bifunctional DNA primase/polymerase [Kyrpidia tusciae DSM 2912]|uniref:Bifunctional DNA primase/polymerase n=1 Tax=Kyrpidia tusciae (strain DSM 2912 / NBRC 15312 / T2) TaxID=562970 RepID=D5WQM6_KYRT2|nr:Bifunctional DNA primase/polymerase [Kyrpidia tusciae DSM 2912]